MTQILGNDKQGLVFEIVSARIYDDVDEKKHVIYTLQLRHISGNDDLSPSVIERRYTHFLTLYNALRTQFPQLMSAVLFPKKVVMGNFDNELISMRSMGFESLLKHISNESQLRCSRPLLDFLQNKELDDAKRFLSNKEYSSALPILENLFRLLNKVLTDRSPPVLLALCRLVGCGAETPHYPNVQKWADLALHRYDGVSDSDLLELYAPLMYTCVKLRTMAGRDKNGLEERLKDLHRKGLKSDCSLLDEVNRIESKLFQHL